MYPVENQLCSLEQAKELAKLLGDHTLPSYFVWAHSCQTAHVSLYIKSGWQPMPICFYNHELTNQRPVSLSKEHYHAHTCAELGVLLPSEISYSYYKINLKNYKDQKTFTVGYKTSTSSPGQPLIYSAHNQCEAHARADLLIKIIKEGLVKPDDLKL